MEGLASPRPQSLSSDECVGLPPFDLFQGTVHEQIRQAIIWRQKELAKSQSSNSPSSLDASPATVSPTDTSPPLQSPSCSIRLADPTIPQLPSTAQPTTPHHHQRYGQLEQRGATQLASLIDPLTPCRPPNFTCVIPTSVPRGGRAQPATACALSTGDNQGHEGGDQDLRFSDTRDCQICPGEAAIAQESDPNRYNTLYNMTEAVKVKEDSTSYGVA